MLHLDATSDVRAMGRKAFPDYNGRKFKLDNSGRAVGVRSYWSGGSRSYFVIVELATGKRMDIPENGSWFVAAVAPEGVKVEPGYVLVEHEYRMGDNGLTFYVNPETALGFLPDKVEVSEDENIVLKASWGLKNSYAGIKDYRFHESRRDHGITRGRWDTAKAALISRKLLNRAGAITTSGKNVIGTTY